LFYVEVSGECLFRDQRFLCQGAPERDDVNLQVVFFDGVVRPDPRHELVLFDDMTGAFDQSDQDIEGTAAEMDRMAAFDSPTRARPRANAGPRLAEQS
jgi:hypothetical protein